MTFNSTPANYSSVNESLIWVVYDAHSTDPVTYPNYKYVAELYINAVKVATSRKFQQPDNNRGVFDFSEEIREYITASLIPVASGVLVKEMGQGAWAIDVVVKIKEEYNGTIGGVVATDRTRTFFNHYNNRYNDFTILGSCINKPLSSRSTTINMFYSNDNFFIPYFSQAGTSFTVTVVGDSTHTKTITPGAANTLQQLNISPGAINAEWAGTISAATQQYTVAFGGVTYTCKLICEAVHTNYPIHFLNQFGGFESFNFCKVHKQTFDVTRKNWKQPAYRIDGSGVLSLKTGNVMYDQQSTFGVKFIEKLKVSTDLLTDAEYQFLSQLVFSPIVYLQDSATLYPVTIEDNNYEYKQIQVDNWTNIELNLAFGTSYKTQFR